MMTNSKPKSSILSAAQAEHMTRDYAYESGSRPVPDPTVLTTKALEREVANLKEMMLRELMSMSDTIRTRFSGMDEATTLLREHQEKVPSETDKAILHLRELMEEMFKSVDKQFIQRDTAVAAALQAAKEAVSAQNESNAIASSKMEVSFTKQIDQTAVLISSQSKGVDDKFDDIKNRVSILEGTIGRGDKTAHVKEFSTQSWIGVAGIVVGAFVALAAILYNKPTPEYYASAPPAVVQSYIPPTR